MKTSLKSKIATIVEMVEKNESSDNILGLRMRELLVGRSVNNLMSDIKKKSFLFDIDNSDFEKVLRVCSSPLNTNEKLEQSLMQLLIGGDERLKYFTEP